jgi:ApaG protein
MVSQITRGIKISVLTSFEGTYFKNYKIHFAFSYEITIENHSKDSVQLISRHWEIFDSLNNNEIVDGEGCLLSSPYGAMKGYFNMVNFTTTKKFKVIVPTFRLCAPFALN